MKLPASLLLATLLGTAAFAESATVPAASPTAPATTIIVPATITELANGFAASVQLMSLKSLVIWCKGEKAPVPVKGIRSVRASSGVLIITFSAGDMMAISAENIVLITDGNRTP
jgi:hypothetical protein